MDYNVTNVISLGRWTLLLKVVNVGTLKWPDYKTTLYLSHLSLSTDVILEMAIANKLYITKKYKIIDDTVSTTYDTDFDTRVDIISSDVKT